MQFFVLNKNVCCDPHTVLKLVQLGTVELQWLEHDGSFTTAVSNSFSSPLEKSHICRSGITSGVSLFHIEKWYIVCTG